MLDPRDRGALLEALRPPPGYVVDAAIATTYSLDLVTLLTAPLASLVGGSSLSAISHNTRFGQPASSLLRTPAAARISCSPKR